MPLRVLRLVVSLVVYLFDRLSAILLAALRIGSRTRLVVIYYHNVPWKYKARFTTQMKILKSVTLPVSIDELSIQLAKPHKMRLLCAITFDDGYESVYNNAVPELSNSAIPFAIFIPSDSIGTSPLWIKDGNHRFSCEKVVNRDQIVDLSHNQFAIIGSHSRSHKDLTALQEKEIEDEVVSSKRKLEGIIRKSVDFISFPHGSFNDIVIGEARKADYKRAFSIDPTVIWLSNSDFVIGRIAVEPWDWPIEFYLKITGAYRWLPTAFRVKKLLRHILR